MGAVSFDQYMLQSCLALTPGPSVCAKQNLMKMTISKTPVLVMNLQDLQTQESCSLTSRCGRIVSETLRGI